MHVEVHQGSLELGSIDLRRSLAEVLDPARAGIKIHDRPVSTMRTTLRANIPLTNTKGKLIAVEMLCTLLKAHLSKFGCHTAPQS